MEGLDPSAVPVQVLMLCSSTPETGPSRSTQSPLNTLAAVWSARFAPFPPYQTSVRQLPKPAAAAKPAALQISAHGHCWQQPWGRSQGRMVQGQQRTS